MSGNDDPPVAQSVRRPRSSQAFWTLAVALPAAFSLLRLWIEAGGQMQIVLLLAANVSATNLLAALFITGTRVASAGLVLIFAIGGVLSVSARAAKAAGRPMARHPLFARWTEAAPLWLLTTTFVLAAATWPILYLPLLMPALVATFQTTPAYHHASRAPMLWAVAGVLPAYSLILIPSLADAWRQGEYFVLCLLALPPLLAVIVSGPMPWMLNRPMAMIVQPAVMLLLTWAVLPAISSPVLPMTVTTVNNPDGTTRFIRGHVIGVDEDMTVILQERGGVQYLDRETVAARVLCPTPEELPVYQLRVRGFHIEDSFLEGIGRRVRPPTPTDAACRGTQGSGTP